MTDRSAQPRRRRRWLKISAWVVALVVLATLFVPQLFVPKIRAKLQAMARDHLHVDLRIGRMWYWLPYGLTMHDVALVRQGEGAGEAPMVALRKLRIEMAKFPTGDGPVVISKLILNEPVVSISKEEPAAAAAAAVEGEAAPEQPKRKPSELFELRRFAVHDGQFRYLDGRDAGAVPLVWRNIEIDMNTTPRATGEYQFHVQVRDGGSARLDAGGSMNIDDATATLERLSLAVQCDPNEPTSHLPEQIQQVIRDHEVRGRLNVDGKGSVFLKEPQRNSYSAVVALDDAGAGMPQWKAWIDRLTLKLTCTSLDPADGAGVQVDIEQFAADSGPLAAIVDRTTAQWRYGAGWRVADVIGRIERREDAPATAPSRAGEAGLLDRLDPSGRLDFVATASGPADDGSSAAARYEVLVYPRRFAIRPPRFPRPIEGVDAGRIRIANGTIELSELSGRYGEDEVQLQSARIPLANVGEELRIEEIAGSILFRHPNVEYPKPLAKAVANLRPAGLYLVSGNYLLGPPPEEHGERRRKDYRFHISSDDGTFALTDRRIPLTHIRGDATLGPKQLILSSVEARLLDGTLAAAGVFDFGSPLRYRGEVETREVDMRALSEALTIEPSKLMTGRGFLKSKISGAGASADEPGSALASIDANGEFELVESEFWSAPVLSGVVKHMNLSRESLTTGEAAAVFEVKQNVLHLKHAAVNAPVLGLQGGGQIGLVDGALKLSIIAAPLADWRNGLKDTGIPVISDVAGEFAGAIQRMLNAATSELLYDFRVTGTIKDPQLTTVPTPLLTEPAAMLFGTMMEKREKDKRLIDSLRPKP